MRIFVYIGSFPENVTRSQHPGIPGGRFIRQCSIAIRERRSYDTCTAKPCTPSLVCRALGTAFIFPLQCSARVAGSETVAASAQQCVEIGRQALRPDGRCRSSCAQPAKARMAYSTSSRNCVPHRLISGSRISRSHDASTLTAGATHCWLSATASNLHDGVHAFPQHGHSRPHNITTIRLDRHDRDGVTPESMTPIPLIGSLPGACKLQDSASGPARKPLVRRLGEK